VSGPKQVQSKFNSETDIANEINILKRGDSTIEYGNLLTVPLDGGLLYVEPVYVRGASTNYPLLKKVLVSYNDDTAFRNTLGEALDEVFGKQGGGTSKPPGDGGTKPPSDANPTVRQELEDAQKAFEAGQKALREQDWTAYGKAQDDLKAALQRAAEAEQKSGDKG
jgi:uncharacterized membrane protein (UPF0182 family)